MLKILCLRNGRADWHRNKGMWVNRMLDSHCEFQLWPHPWPSPQIFKVKFFISIFLGMGRLIDLEWKRWQLDIMLGAQRRWFFFGHSAWQIYWASNGSMRNCYSFKHVGPWMSCPFTDLGAEGCCNFLNALLFLVCHRYQELYFMLTYCNYIWNCIVVYCSTSCKTTSDRWVILVKCVLKK